MTKNLLECLWIGCGGWMGVDTIMTISTQVLFLVVMERSVGMEERLKSNGVDSSRDMSKEVLPSVQR